MSAGDWRKGSAGGNEHCAADAAALSGRVATKLADADVADLHPQFHLPGDLPADTATVSRRPVTIVDGKGADLHPDPHPSGDMDADAARPVKTETAENE